MKTKLIILAILGLFILTACTQNKEEALREQVAEQSQSDFQTLCYQNRGMWMKMKPIINGQSTGEPACFGCMPNRYNHICDENEYKQMLGIQ